MKKTNQKPDASADKKQSSTKRDTVLPPANQEQVPFLYIAMREPSEEYKKALDSKSRLYRFIKIR